MTPLRITATLRNGFASSDPWSPAIDGILAYWHVREQLGEEQFALTSVDSSAMEPVTDLPLAKTEWQGEWWYQCSSPIYATRAEFLRYYHRRFDIGAAQQYLQPQRGRVETKAGPFKAYRLSARVIVTPEVQWYAVGDSEEVRRLLRRCSAIGAKVGQGFGRVQAWTVETLRELPPYGGASDRPIPAEYARQIGAEGPMLLWGLRPPGRIRENLCVCVMPGGN